MQVIEGFKQLAAVDIAWSDGAGWLLGLVACWIVMGGILFYRESVAKNSNW
jgi:hypothetical protein